MTKEQEKISEKNWKKARDYFISIGAIPENAKPYSFAMHHINPDWKENDIERYIQWNISDLVVMDYAEHSRLHNTGRVLSEESRMKTSESLKGKMKGVHKSEEAKRNISKALKGKPRPYVSERNRNRVWDEETKRRISNSLKGNVPANKGSYWFTNGVVNVMRTECPEGFWRGMTRNNKKQ